jgi:hypothetical protein
MKGSKQAEPEIQTKYLISSDSKYSSGYSTRNTTTEMNLWLLGDDDNNNKPVNAE